MYTTYSLVSWRLSAIALSIIISSSSSQSGDSDLTCTTGNYKACTQHPLIICDVSPIMYLHAKTNKLKASSVAHTSDSDSLELKQTYIPRRGYNHSMPARPAHHYSAHQVFIGGGGNDNFTPHYRAAELAVHYTLQQAQRSIDSRLPSL